MSPGVSPGVSPDVAPVGFAKRRNVFPFLPPIYSGNDVAYVCGIPKVRRKNLTLSGSFNEDLNPCYALYVKGITRVKHFPGSLCEELNLCYAIYVKGITGVKRCFG